jgi:hypothetical protein
MLTSGFDRARRQSVDYYNFVVKFVPKINPATIMSETKMQKRKTSMDSPK